MKNYPLQWKTLKEEIKHLILEANFTELESIYLCDHDPESSFSGQYHNVNLLCVYSDISSEILDTHHRIQKTVKKKLSATLSLSIKLFTTQELRHGLDVFPIEFLDIQENNHLLYGKDSVKALSIKTTHLRHECEFYLRSTVLKLREAYCQPHHDLATAIRLSFPMVISVFKHLLPLLKLKKEQDPRLIIASLSKKLTFNIDIFNSILDHVDQKDLSHMFHPYLRELKGITQQVDQLHS